MEPMSKFCDPVYNIYKIPWAILIGQSSKQYSLLIGQQHTSRQYSQYSTSIEMKSGGAGGVDTQLSVATPAVSGGYGSSFEFS